MGCVSAGLALGFMQMHFALRKLWLRLGLHVRRLPALAPSNGSILQQCTPLRLFQRTSGTHCNPRGQPSGAAAASACCG